MRTNQNAQMSAGEDKTLVISVANPSGASITGMTATYAVVPYPFGPPPAIIEKSTGSGITVETGVNVPAGYAFNLRVTLTNDDTKAMQPGWYHHEATCILSTGAVIEAMEGQLRIDPTWIASKL